MQWQAYVPDSSKSWQVAFGSQISGVSWHAYTRLQSALFSFIPSNLHPTRQWHSNDPGKLIHWCLRCSQACSSRPSLIFSLQKGTRTKNLEKSSKLCFQLKSTKIYSCLALQCNSSFTSFSQLGIKNPKNFKISRFESINTHVIIIYSVLGEIWLSPKSLNLTLTVIKYSVLKYAYLTVMNQFRN